MIDFVDRCSQKTSKYHEQTIVVSDNKLKIVIAQSVDVPGAYDIRVNYSDLAKTGTYKLGTKDMKLECLKSSRRIAKNFIDEVIKERLTAKYEGCERAPEQTLSNIKLDNEHDDRLHFVRTVKPCEGKGSVEDLTRELLRVLGVDAELTRSTKEVPRFSLS